MRTSLVSTALLATSLLFAQNWTIEEVGTLPFKTANNAVTLAYTNGQPHIYSFCGIDSTLNRSGIHLQAGAVNIQTGESIQYADVPDTLGKIAAGASTVKNKIYLIGGYHVYANGSELSSNKVHCFDPENETWEADKQNIPVAIDDHVQAVWQDSLIYVITGWSDTRNVPNVQIYNPTVDEWSVGTAVPDNTLYTAFGASGTIIGNTIYYLGGANMGNNFPATWRLRIGEIDPTNTTDITWRDSLLRTDQKFYRAACTQVGGYPLWFGGASTTYNYDALSYSGGAVVQPANKSYLYVSTTESSSYSSPSLPMDLRGVGELSKTTKILAGGMYADRTVSDKVIQCTWGYPADVESVKQQEILFYPNPTSGMLYLSQKRKVKVYTATGQLVYAGETKQINTQDWTSGLYTITVMQGDKHYTHSIIVSNE